MGDEPASVIGSPNQTPRLPSDHVARLVIEVSPDARLVGTVLTLEHEQTILGRPACGANFYVSLTGGAVSRNTARFGYTEGWWVEDLGSANGTYLNGTRILDARRPLASGDVIDLGGDLDEQGERRGHARVVFHGPGDRMAVDAKRAEFAQRNITQRLSAGEVTYLAIEGSPGHVDDVVALEHACTSLGRAACANVRVALAGPNVGRDNTRFVFHRNAWCAEDSGSVNGTRVNGTLLGPSERRPLLVGDVIEIGGIVDGGGELRGQLRVVFRGPQPAIGDPPARHLY